MVNNKSLKFLISFCMLVFSTNTISQPYKEDSLAVRAILDSNGLSNVSVEEVTTKVNDRIVSLKLQYRDLSTLPKDIGILTALDSLDLHNNKLKEIPIEIGNLTSLKEINLENNKIAHLTKEIGNCKLLEVLNLKKNELISLPEEIGNFTSLIFLYIDFNEVNSLPLEIGNLINLKLLTLSSNLLNTLPDELCNLTSLIALDLNKNNLTSLPSQIGNLTELLTLVIDSNNLETLPAGIWDLGNKLTTFSVKYNNLKTLPDGIDIPNNSYDCFCFNDSLTFTEDQKEFFRVDDYEDYFDEYCDLVDIEKESQKETISTRHNFITISKNKITFSIPLGSVVSIEIYNVRGRLLESFRNTYNNAGIYTVNWSGNKYGSGVYYFRLRTGNSTISKKAFILR